MLIRMQGMEHSPGFSVFTIQSTEDSGLNLKRCIVPLSALFLAHVLSILVLSVDQTQRLSIERT